MRAVASHTGAELASSRGPGGTRKVALLTGALGGILRNFNTYTNGLWACVGWVQAGHQGHPLQSLLDKGRRLTPPVFLLCFSCAIYLKGCSALLQSKVQGMGEPSQCEAIGSRFWAGLAKQKVAWRVCQTVFDSACIVQAACASVGLGGSLAHFGCTVGWRSLSWLLRWSSRDLEGEPSKVPGCGVSDSTRHASRP